MTTAKEPHRWRGRDGTIPAFHLHIAEGDIAFSDSPNRVAGGTPRDVVRADRGIRRTVPGHSGPVVDTKRPVPVIMVGPLPQPDGIQNGGFASRPTMVALQPRRIFPELVGPDPDFLLVDIVPHRDPCVRGIIGDEDARRIIGAIAC